MWNTRETIGSLQRASGTRRTFKELASAVGNLKVFKKLLGGIGKSIAKGYEPWSGGGGWKLFSRAGDSLGMYRTCGCRELEWSQET